MGPVTLTLTYRAGDIIGNEHPREVEATREDLTLVPVLTLCFDSGDWLERTLRLVAFGVCVERAEVIEHGPTHPVYK